MSTKCTLGHGPQHHLYAECFENENVHLQLDRLEYEVCRYDGADSLRVAIPIKLWREIVQAWLESEWSKDPGRDNAKLEFDTG